MEFIWLIVLPCLWEGGGHPLSLFLKRTVSSTYSRGEEAFVLSERGHGFEYFAKKKQSA